MNLNTEAKVLDPKKETIECNFFDLQIGRKIENLFLLQSVLLVVSKTSMYEVDLSNCPSEVSFDLIFNNKTHAETERVIKDAEYMKRHQSVYLMIRNERDLDTLFCKYDFNGKSDQKVLVNRVDLKVDRFEVSYKDPFHLFLVSKKTVFRFVLMDVTTNFKSILKQKFSKLKKGSSAQTSKFAFSKRLKEVYSNNINRIKFFKFDKEMKHFYCHDKNIIKTCAFDSGEEVSSMITAGAEVRMLWFTRDFHT